MAAAQLDSTSIAIYATLVYLRSVSLNNKRGVLLLLLLLLMAPSLFLVGSLSIPS